MSRIIYRSCFELSACCSQLAGQHALEPQAGHTKIRNRLRFALEPDESGNSYLLMLNRNSSTSGMPPW